MRRLYQGKDPRQGPRQRLSRQEKMVYQRLIGKTEDTECEDGKEQAL